MTGEFVEVTPIEQLVGNQCGVPDCARPVTFPHVAMVFDAGPWTFVMPARRCVSTKFCGPHRAQWNRGELHLPLKASA
jgi:hypothetical protein